MRHFGKTGQTASLPYIFRRSLHVALRRPERMKSVVRSPAFRRNLLASWNGSASDACGLKAGLQTDFPQEPSCRSRRHEAGLDLLIQPVSSRTAGDVHKRGRPVERGKKLVEYRTRRYDARPADDARSAVTALPGLAFLAFERSDAAVGEADRLGLRQGGAMPCSVGVLLMSGKLTCCIASRW